MPIVVIDNDGTKKAIEAIMVGQGYLVTEQSPGVVRIGGPRGPGHVTRTRTLTVTNEVTHQAPTLTDYKTNQRTVSAGATGWWINTTVTQYWSITRTVTAPKELTKAYWATRDYTRHQIVSVAPISSVTNSVTVEAAVSTTVTQDVIVTVTDSNTRTVTA